MYDRLHPGGLFSIQGRVVDANGVPLDDPPGQASLGETNASPAAKEAAKAADAARQDAWNATASGSSANPSDAIPASSAAALDAAADGAPLVVRELTVAELNALVGSLSVSFRKALGVADALRRERSADAVHMEHLLAAAYTQQGGHQWQVFEDAAIDSIMLSRRLAEFELVVTPVPNSSASGPRTLILPDAGPITTMPPVSGHVALALAAAASAAAWTVDSPPEPGAVHASHLLVGILAVRECHVVQGFDRERDMLRVSLLGRALDARVDPRIARSAAYAADQRRRISALLDDPPRVVWQRLTPTAPNATPNATPNAAPNAAPTSNAEPTPSVPPTPRIGSGGGAANDRAEGDDRLGFSAYVQAFANLIDSPDTRPPLTIGIYGAWGAGKSFLLTHLTDELARRGAGMRPHPGRELGAWIRHWWRPEPPVARRAYVYSVAFNAWEYNAADHIWPRLVRRVLDSVTQHAQWRPLRLVQQLARKFRRNFVRKARADWKSLVAWIVVGAGLWWGFAHLRPDDAERFADNVFGVQTSTDKFSLPAIVGALTAVVKLVVDTLLAPLGGWITAMLDDGPGYGTESDFVRAVRSDLDLIDRQLVRENARVLIVIDDLDRCEPDKAVEVLQAINQLLDRRSFIVCLGIDARVITAAVEKHYEDLLGPAGVTGYEYLDKIIQIPFRIPEPSGDDLMLFVAKQLGDPPPPNAQRAQDTPAANLDQMATKPEETGSAALAMAAAARAAIEGPLGDVVDGSLPGTRAAAAVGANVTAGLLGVPLTPTAPPVTALSFTHDELLAFRDIAPYLRPNPRHVKRLVNVYALVRSLAELASNRTILDDPAATIRWLTLGAQWPYAVRAMLLHLDAHGVPDPTTPPIAPLRWLHDAVRPSLDAAKRARFDHDASVLEKLVATSEGLSWDELRVLRAYTVNFNPALDAELRADVAAPPHRRAELGDATVTQFDRRRTPPA